MRERLPGGRVKGRKVVILGDILHSRVARSNIWSLTAAGADLWLCGPSTLLRGLDAWAGRAGGFPGHGRFTVTSDVDAAPARRRRRHGTADPEGADGLRPPAVTARVHARYGLTLERLAGAKTDAIVMHPGPMNEGVEIARPSRLDRA